MSVMETMTALLPLLEQKADLLSAAGSCIAAGFAAYAAFLSRSQHRESLASAPTILPPNTMPRAQLHLDDPEVWDGMGGFGLTVRNIGSGPLQKASILYELREVSGKRLRDLAGVELAAVNLRSLKISADGREIIRLLNGVANGQVPMASIVQGDTFELQPGGEHGVDPPRDIYACALAHALFTDSVRRPGAPSSSLHVVIKYKSIGRHRQKRKIVLDLMPHDLGTVPALYPVAVGANLRPQLRYMS